MILMKLDFFSVFSKFFYESAGNLSPALCCNFPIFGNYRNGSYFPNISLIQYMVCNKFLWCLEILLSMVK